MYRAIIYRLTLLFFLSTLFPIGLFASKKVNLIWQFDQQHRCEEDWLMEILSDVDVNVVSDGNYDVYLDNSLVIISFWHGREHQRKYFEIMRDLGYNFGIIHLSDEFYHAETDFYRYARFVLRSYWHKKFEAMDNVYILPLGYKAGFWPGNIRLPLKPVCERQYTWSFAGQLTNKPTRMAMINSLKEVDGYYVHETNTWADPNGLNTLDYRDMLLDSIFAPCPTGFWNVDSFRSSEALECGCIPIVERGPNDYFAKFYGDHPCLVVDTWREAKDLMINLLHDPERLQALQNECIDWWERYKAEIKAKVASLVESTLLRNSPQSPPESAEGVRFTNIGNTL